MRNVAHSVLSFEVIEAGQVLSCGGLRRHLLQHQPPDGSTPAIRYPLHDPSLKICVLPAASRPACPPRGIDGPQPSVAALVAGGDAEHVGPLGDTALLPFEIEGR